MNHYYPHILEAEMEKNTYMSIYLDWRNSDCVKCVNLVLF